MKPGAGQRQKADAYEEELHRKLSGSGMAEKPAKPRILNRQKKVERTKEQQGLKERTPKLYSSTKTKSAGKPKTALTKEKNCENGIRY